MILTYVIAWLPMTLIAIANGIAREYVFRRFLGELAAHQLSTATLIVLFAAYTYLLVRKWAPGSRSRALLIGCIWLCMTVAFEFGFGHYIAGHPWERLLADYNLMAGRVWVLVLAWITVAPYIMRRFVR